MFENLCLQCVARILKSQCPSTFTIYRHYREHFSESVPADLWGWWGRTYLPMKRICYWGGGLLHSKRSFLCATRRVMLLCVYVCTCVCNARGGLSPP